MTVLQQYRPGLWLTELSLDEFDVRGAVVVGSERVLIWDTLSQPRDMAPVHEMMQDRPFVVAYSHADWDHVWGTAGLAPGAPIVAQATCLARFANDVPATLQQMRKDQPERWDDVVLLPPFIVFDESMTVDLGGVTVELVHLPGHTPDCIVAFLPEWGILLAGDTVETPFPVVNDGAALSGWIAHLERWASDERVATVIPAHGKIAGRELIRHNVDYLTSLLKDTAPPKMAGLSPFYDTTHQANRACVGEWRDR
jgi:glyoxylase-like metal-dependent hydrolase (beta-lactamase superfamily II)